MELKRTGRRRRLYFAGLLAAVAAAPLQGACSEKTNLADQGFFESGTAPATGDAEHPPSNVPHGDHTPHKGGTVMMYGDLHYEVLLERTGRYALYLSDDLRKELPASTVSDVAFTIRFPNGEVDAVTLEPDPEGTAWFGTGKPVDDPKTVVRVGFEYLERPYWIDLLFPQVQFQETATDPVPDALRQTNGPTP